MDTNTFSEIAKKIVRQGLDKRDLSIPSKFFAIAKEVYGEPEKPIDYNPKNLKSKPERVILVTGGLDSTTLYFKLIKKYPDLKTYYVDIGQSYAQKELEALYRLNIDVEIITDKDFTTLENTGWKHIIPGRNFYFLCLVAERMKGGIIYFGSTNGDTPIKGGDRSKRFVSLVNKLFATLPYPVKVETPMIEFTKTEEVAWMKKNGLLKELDNTLSCFDGKVGNCGHCRACLVKAIAFINNDLQLKTNVSVVKNCGEYIEGFKSIMTKNLAEHTFDHFSRKYCVSVLAGIRKLEEAK